MNCVVNVSDIYRKKKKKWVPGWVSIEAAVMR